MNVTVEIYAKKEYDLEVSKVPTTRIEVENPKDSSKETSPQVETIEDEEETTGEHVEIVEAPPDLSQYS